MKTKQALSPVFFSLFATAFIAVLLCGCKAQRVDTQGVVGQVYWIEGNQMPTITDGDNVTPAKPERKKVKRTIRIYERTHINQATMGDHLFKDIETPMIAEIETEEDGSFAIGLAPGAYSIFTVEENGYFANVYDLDSYIQPVEVKENEWNNIQILINYKAAY
ncbi:carboxypeptidase regulatory-like domain-containing protein [Echinicola soli]|uniref:Carboxypeptidase regulatory-like domain-containing protein n=1 Tax=Echinicola soli TaxID=2591634 RepID=A0A514CDD9_9BACT|nr:carboxypeptidase regulatory-like domain-containing protein [Echinicola soli]QDH77838.1 carboxypeptidase regulatory-like domain-containing protein [Echinicola soli]